MKILLRLLLLLSFVLQGKQGLGKWLLCMPVCLFMLIGHGVGGRLGRWSAQALKENKTDLHPDGWILFSLPMAIGYQAVGHCSASDDLSCVDRVIDNQTLGRLGAHIETDGEF